MLFMKGQGNPCAILFRIVDVPKIISCGWAEVSYYDLSGSQSFPPILLVEGCELIDLCRTKGLDIDDIFTFLEHMVSLSPS